MFCLNEQVRLWWRCSWRASTAGWQTASAASCCLLGAIRWVGAPVFSPPATAEQLDGGTWVGGCHNHSRAALIQTFLFSHAWRYILGGRWAQLLAGREERWRVTRGLGGGEEAVPVTNTPAWQQTPHLQPLLPAAYLYSWIIFWLLPNTYILLLPPHLLSPSSLPTSKHDLRIRFHCHSRAFAAAHTLRQATRPLQAY